MARANSPKSGAESPQPCAEDGVALVIVLLVMAALTALAMSLALLASTESRVTAAYRDGMEVLYGAEAALERVLPDLAREGDFNGVLAGVVTSSFVDGPPGPRKLPDGTFMNLHELTEIAGCGRVGCADDDADARWRLYSYGFLLEASRVYTCVWVADDPSETDADPLTDGGEAGGAENPGRGRLSLIAHGYGPTGTRRVVEATIARSGSELRVISWREVR